MTDTASSARARSGICRLFEEGVARATPLQRRRVDGASCGA